MRTSSAASQPAVADVASRRSMRASLKLSEPRNTYGTYRQSRSAGEERRARTQSHSLSLGLLIQLSSSRVPRLIIASFCVECISDRKETTIIVASCELDPILHYFPIIYASASTGGKRSYRAKRFRGGQLRQMVVDRTSGVAK
jgi:hypothetical protein